MTLLHDAVQEFATAVAADIKKINEELHSVINDEAVAGTGNTWSIDKVKAHVEAAAHDLEERVHAAFTTAVADLEARFTAHKQEVAASIPPLPQPVDLTAVYNTAKG
jgi:predicted outer membrane protein